MGIDSQALAAVDGDGVAVGQAVAGDVLGVEVLGSSVVHCCGEGPGFGVDGEHAPPLTGHQLAPGARRQGDDAVTGGVAGASGGEQLGAGEVAHPGPRRSPKPVQLGHVHPPPGEHGDVVIGAPAWPRSRGRGNVPGPAGDEGLSRFLDGGLDHDAVIGHVPVDRFGDVAGPELGQGVALGDVALAHVLPQHVNRSGVALKYGAHGPAGADGGQLAVVADNDHLGLGPLGGLEQS